MTQEPNCYIGILADNEISARLICEEYFYSLPLNLVHKETPEEVEEQPTWIFSFWADVLEPDEMDRLHDHYDLPDLENLPYEFI